MNLNSEFCFDVTKLEPEKNIFVFWFNIVIFNSVGNKRVFIRNPPEDEEGDPINPSLNVKSVRSLDTGFIT